MDNRPVENVRLPIHSIVAYENEEGIWCIRDENTGVATQGDSKLEALLMLTDAVAAYEDAEMDLSAKAKDIFEK